MKPSSGAIYCLDFGYPPTPSSLVNWIQWEHDVRNNCWMKFLASGGDRESGVGRELSCFLSGNLCCSTHIGLSETELKRCALVQKFVLGWVTLSILSTLLCWHYDVMLFQWRFSKCLNWYFLLLSRSIFEAFWCESFLIQVDENHIREIDPIFVN